MQRYADHDSLLKGTKRESSQVLNEIIGDPDKISLGGLSFMNRNRLACVIDHEIRSRMGIWRIEPLISRKGRIFNMGRKMWPTISVDGIAYNDKFFYSIRHPDLFQSLASTSCNLFGTGHLVSMAFPRTYWRNVLFTLAKDLEPVLINHKGKDIIL